MNGDRGVDSQSHAGIVTLEPCVARTPQSPLREMAFRKSAWTPDEIDQLRSMFENDHSLDEIAAAMGRPRGSIVHRIETLGMRRETNRAWSELDDQTLGRRYGTENAATIAVSLGRSATAVYARARLLGVSDPGPLPYAPWEDEQIRAGFASGSSVEEIARTIGRPFSGVVSRAHGLGLKHACAPDHWTIDEITRALTLAHAGHRYPEIVAKLTSEGFPERSVAGLGPKIRKMGYSRGWGKAWLPEEDDLLRNAYRSGESLAPLREPLSRSRSSIAYRAGELHLEHQRPTGFRQGPIWSEEDNARLRQGYGRVPSRELAEQLGRGLRAMLIHANALGLVHGFLRPFGDDERRAVEIAWRTGISLTDLATAMDRDPAVVAKFATRIGFRLGG